ncbi:MAG: glutamine--fructose-6-phosphate transaminase (isomerizing) [archaeon]
MCGIIGYIGKEQAAPLLMKGLSRLEYRGYDSAGICIANGDLMTIKCPGHIADLARILPALVGTRGIAHTRWATHGPPTEINAHPHCDCKNTIALVHNGIIENHDALRKMLEGEGHAFRSQTDSEVIVHLIEKFYQGNLEGAVLQAIALLEGTFGLAIIHRDENKIIAVRRGSPLIIGIAKHGMFLSSDAAALLDHTTNVIYLRDNELASLTSTTYNIMSFDGKQLNANVEKIHWTLDAIEKAGYKHFMLKEIMEQPHAIANTLRGRITPTQIKLTIALPERIGRIILLGCGTSWHAALIGKYLLEKLTRIPVEVDYASEFRYRQPIITKDDIVIVLSQSGETADTLGALRAVRHATTVGLVNVVGSTISREVQSGIYLHAGPEIGVASTKAFTCQVTALALLALYLQEHRDHDLAEALLRIPDLVAEVLESNERIRGIAKLFINDHNALYLGRGVQFPVALEGALKLKEISYLHAEGYPAAEMKHGPIALIDERMPAVIIAPHDKLFDKVMSNMQEIKARHGRVIVITDEPDERLKQADHILYVPKTREELMPLLTVIPLQLLAYHIADLKGLPVDKPRNLAKAVTVE